jgi:hypothetical protein
MMSTMAVMSALSWMVGPVSGASYTARKQM